MTQDEIIDLATEAGLAYNSDDYPDIWDTYMNVGREEIMAFAKLVAAKATASEREACAKIAEHSFGVIGSTIALAIRARGEALAQPEQEPVACNCNQGQVCHVCDPITPPQRTEQEPVFRFQMQLQDGWGGQYPKAIPIGDPDFESLFKSIGDIVTFYAAPPQRTWVGLEGEEIRNLWEEATKPDRSTMTIVTSFARAIDAKIKQKNGFAEEKNT